MTGFASAESLLSRILGVLTTVRSIAAPDISTHFKADASATLVTVQSSAGYVTHLEVQNPNTSEAYLQLFDDAAATVGADTPKQSFLIPAGDGTNVGQMDKSFAAPIRFATAIAYAVTTTATGGAAPTSDCVVNMGYA